MGLTCKIDSSTRIISTTATGFISGADLEAHLCHTNEGGTSGYAQLIDARSATLLFTSTDLCWLAFTLRSLAKNHSQGPIAVIVSSDPNAGMVRMLKRLSGDTCSIEAFRDPLEAERWIQSQRERVA